MLLLMFRPNAMQMHCTSTEPIDYYVCCCGCLTTTSLRIISKIAASNLDSSKFRTHYCLWQALQAQSRVSNSDFVEIGLYWILSAMLEMLYDNEQAVCIAENCHIPSFLYTAYSLKRLDTLSLFT